MNISKIFIRLKKFLSPTSINYETGKIVISVYRIWYESHIIWLILNIRFSNVYKSFVMFLKNSPQKTPHNNRLLEIRKTNENKTYFCCIILPQSSYQWIWWERWTERLGYKTRKNVLNSVRNTMKTTILQLLTVSNSQNVFNRPFEVCDFWEKQR